MKKEDIEKKVNEIIEKNNIQYPLDIVSFLHEKGFMLLQKNMGDNSGAILVDPENKIQAIAVNKNDCVDRRRFTLAHEYGHYILHNNNKNVFYANRCDANSSFEEKEADEFAACLLMPRDKVEKSIKGLDFDILKVLKVQRDFIVSEPAAIVRLRRLGLM